MKTERQMSVYMYESRSSVQSAMIAHNFVSNFTRDIERLTMVEEYEEK